MYPKKIHSTTAKMKSLMLKENPTLQRYVANTLNYSISTVNKNVNSDLNFKMTEKYSVHHLSQHHNYEHRTCCRTLYEKHLSGEKSCNNR